MTQIHQQNILNQRYQILEVIGKGAMGITYKAQDLQTNTNVAIKVISLRNLTSAKQLELIEREVQVLQKLNHPNIPRYLDYFEVDTQSDRLFYLVQELIEGKNLEQWVKQGWRVTEKEVKEIAEQLLKVLDYLHNLEPPVIHRDIKPHNLLRTESRKIYLVDFGGIQNAYYTAFHGGSTTVGTFGYMALEQANGKAVPASDLYSLGATLLYVLTHRPPEALSNGLSFDFRSHIKLSEGFADWLEKMLEADVNERFSSAKDALTALKNPKLVMEGRLNPYRHLVWLGLVMTIFGGVNLFQSNQWAILSRLRLSKAVPEEVCHR